MHATLVNTVYARRKARSDGGGGGKGRGRGGRVTFDATEILRVFNEEGGGGGGGGRLPPNPPLSSSPSPSALASQSTSSITSSGAYTFASDILISSVQICEMGAKKLDGESDPEGMLGERYVVVGEKGICASWKERCC